MGTLYLVRHGQASFGAANYDQLSELGVRQSVRLGEYFRHKGIRFDAVLHGTLARQIQTWQGIAAGCAQQLQAVVWPQLNEYDSQAVIRAVHPESMHQPETPEAVRHYFRVLRDGLNQWAEAKVAPQGMPSYAAFAQGLADALHHVRSQYDGNVLLVSSGGPIATAVAQVLGAPPQTAIELNLRIRNSAISEMAFNPKRHVLMTFNTLPHLEADAYSSWVTFT